MAQENVAIKKKFNLTNPLVLAGAVAAPFTYAHFMCKHMYETGVVDRMYSSEFGQRVVGNLDSMGYTAAWMIALPVTAIMGAIALGSVGKGLDKILHLE